MATLDTTRLIQPALTLAPTTTMQPKPAEGFQRLLDDETHKVSNPVQLKATESVSRPAREASEPAKALRPSAKSPNETKARFEQDSTDARRAVKPAGDSARARSEASTKVSQRKAAARYSESEVTDGSVELAAESASRQ